MDKDKFAKLFPLGSHLCREPMPPMAEMKKDMETLKRHGFNLVKLQEQWACDEPVEGRYEFSKYEELISYAAKLDLGVYLGLTMEQVPSWLWRKHPDCRMIGRNGQPIAYEAQSTMSSDGKPGPCYDHEGAMADQLRFVRQIVRNLGRFENIVIWNTWQEIGYWADQHVCYCKHTIQSYHQWLQEKYKDIDGLNRAWNTRYPDWQSIMPDRRPGSDSSMPHDVDWRYFIDNARLEKILTARANAIRAEDPLNRPVFAHMGRVTIGSGAEWRYAGCQDFLSSSFYPCTTWSIRRPWDDDRPPWRKEAALLNENWYVASSSDYLRSCNKGASQILAAEFQGGPVNNGIHIGRTPSAADIRRWMLTSVGGGMTGIAFWVTRAEISSLELNGYGLLDSVGDSTERLLEAGRVGKALNAHADIFNTSSSPKPEAAILVNEWNYKFCEAANCAEHLRYSTRGWHRFFWDMGIPVDFVEASEFDNGRLPDYKLLVMPFPLSLSEELAAHLERFVEHGGTLISEACPGRVDEHAYCTRGELSPLMSRLFGVSQQTLSLVREPDGGQRWYAEERTWGEYLEPALLSGVGPLAGHQLRANLYVETFNANDAIPVLSYGENVAGVMRKVGKGAAWLLGTFVGHSGTAYRSKDVSDCVRKILDLSGINSVSPGRLLLNKRCGKDKEAWFIFNPTDSAVAETLDCTGWKHVADLLGEPLTRDGGSVTLTVQSLDVRVLITCR
ncbi:MAG: beta-galactosidase [Victivallales bacterium]